VGAILLNFLADVIPASTKWPLDSGDTAWQLTAATFVGLQSLPGLAILYGGIVKRKWALNSAVMCFYAFSIVLVCWVLWGYNMAFGKPLTMGPGILGGIVGIPWPSTGADFETAQASNFLNPAAAGSLPPLQFPGSAMTYFQFVFAAITPILIAGSVFGRMSFKAWMLFVPLWSSLVYTVGAFMIWGGGWLAAGGLSWMANGAVDYSGGYVIHLAAGISGFVAAAVVGPRLLEDQVSFNPNNMIMALAGAGILWLGWNGFNGGDPYFANADAGAAVLNTNLCTAVSLLCWLVLDMWATGKPNAVSMINGMIVGLVAITPAAGFVDGLGAIVIGLVAGVIAWFSYNKVAHTGFFKKVDDTLGVFHTHGVAGFVGGMMVGLVGNPQMIMFYANPKVKGSSDFSISGLFYTGSWQQLWSQFVAAAVIIVWNIIGTYIVLQIVKIFVPLRATDGQMEGGDLAIHGMDPMPLHTADAPTG